MSLMFSSGSMVFSEEVCLHIFAFLDEKTLVKCCQVNSLWKALATDNLRWEDLAKKIFMDDSRLVSSTKKSLQNFTFTLTSDIAIVQRVESFVCKMCLGENGEFKAIFYSKEDNPQILSILFKGNQAPIHPTQSPLKELNLKEFFVFQHRIGDGSLPQTIRSKKPSSYFYWFEDGKTERTSLIRVPVQGSFQAVLTSPKGFQENSRKPLEIINRIEDILFKKLEDLDKESKKNRSLFFNWNGSKKL